MAGYSPLPSGPVLSTQLTAFPIQLSVNGGPNHLVYPVSKKNKRQGVEIAAQYPNPFISTTRIRYATFQTTEVTIELYDMLGRRVRRYLEGVLEAGTHQFIIPGSDLSAGTYVCSGSCVERIL